MDVAITSHYFRNLCKVTRLLAVLFSAKNLLKCQLTDDDLDGMFISTGSNPLFMQNTNYR